jgi:hypothetical protein
MLSSHGHLLARLAACCLVAACQAQPPAATVAATPGPAAASGHAMQGDPAANILERIRSEIGGAPCDHDAQCRTLAVGQKACGGPEAWLAWSTAASDGPRLSALSDESARLARERNARSGMLSNCLYNADPGAQCLAGRCVKRNLRSAN